MCEDRKKTLSECRQTCRVKVRINGGEESVVEVLMAHQTTGGLNSRPCGDRVHLVPGGWFNTDDVELIEVLPWQG